MDHENQKAANQESYLRLQPYLQCARTNALCARSILMNIDEAESEVAIHIARGWHAVVCVQALESGKPLPALADFASSLDRAAISVFSALPAEKWNEDMQAFQRAASQPSWEYAPTHEVYLAELRNHCDLLDVSIAAIAKQLRKKYSITWWSSKTFRWSAIGVGVVAVSALCGSLIYRLIQAPPPPPPPSPPLPWRAEFFDNAKLQGQPKKIVRDAKIDFSWGMGKPFPEFAVDNFSARWESCLKLERTQEVKFTLGSDDGSRLAIDGEVLVENWGAHGYKTQESSIRLQSGVHHLKVEYFELSGHARVTLTAEPAELLSLTNLSAPGDDKTNPCGHVNTPQ